MSEHAWIVVGMVAGLVVLGVVALGALALWLGRPLRAQGRARLGAVHEFAVAVEVPEATAAQRCERSERVLPPQKKPGARR